MSRRQSIPRQWLIVPREVDRRTLTALRNLQRGTGVLLLERPNATAQRQMRNIASAKNLTIVCEGSRVAARVHNMGELRQALLQRTRLILLSPIHHTTSHPDWPPLPRMRAAMFARLARRSLLALGGMSAERYAKVEQLGFAGWAGISGFRT